MLTKVHLLVLHIVVCRTVQDSGNTSQAEVSDDRNVNTEPREDEYLSKF